MTYTCLISPFPPLSEYTTMGGGGGGVKCQPAKVMSEKLQKWPKTLVLHYVGMHRSEPRDMPFLICNRFISLPHDKLGCELDPISVLGAPQRGTPVASSPCPLKNTSGLVSPKVEGGESAKKVGQSYNCIPTLGYNSWPRQRMGGGRYLRHVYATHLSMYLKLTRGPPLLGDG